MIATKTIVLYFLCSGGFCASSFALAQDKLDIVERYGLLGLHALVVLGIGAGMLKIGWEQVKTSRQIEAVLSSMSKKMDDEHEENEEERSEAVDEVKKAIVDARDVVVAHMKAAFRTR